MKSGAKTQRNKILVLGAGGFIGASIVRRFLTQGQPVICCGRNTSRLKRLFPSCEVLSGEFGKEFNSANWSSCLTQVDVLINAVGIFREQSQNCFEAVHTKGPVDVFRAAQRAGVRKVIQLSALGADSESNTNFHMSKRTADDALASLSLEWVILQASLVYGPGGASTNFFKALAALPLIPIIGKGDQYLQPAHVEDVVETVIKLIPLDSPARIRLPVIGPEPMSLESLLKAYRHWLGLPPARTITFPPFLTRIAGLLGDHLGWTFVTSDSIAMLRRGNTSSVNHFTRTMGIVPRSLQDSLLQSPSCQEDRMQARLFFLGTFLRLSIAFVWIIAGLVSAFVFPLETSTAFLAKAGITGLVAPIVLYAASGLDVVLGLATLANFRIKLIGTIQLFLIVAFTIILTLALPELWTHPFGPLTKNVPLCVGTLIMMALEDDV